VSLGLTRIKLGTLRGHFSDPEIIRQFDEVTQLMKQIIAEIRSLTFELSPPILYEFGLEPALEWLASSMQAQHQLKCTFKTSGDGKALQQEYNVLMFQAARELLVNVVKHSRARQVALELIKSQDKVQVQVRDDGVGFDASQAMLTPEKTLGFGLFSVRERIHLLGGVFAIESQPGHGTCVTLTLPVTA
jgi:signal transduction histidine kinase